MRTTVEQKSTTWDEAVAALFADIKRWAADEAEWATEPYGGARGRDPRSDALLLRTPRGEFLVDPLPDRGPGGRGLVDLYILNTLESSYIVPKGGSWVWQDPFRVGEPGPARPWNRQEFLETIAGLIADAG